MGYQINSTWTSLRKDDIEKLNKIIDDEYCNELEISRKLNLMDKLNNAFDEELERLNFDIIEKFMQDNNWVWAIYKNGKCYHEVPDRYYMRDQLRNDFLKHIMFDIIELNKTESGRESGGFYVELGVRGDDVWCTIHFDIGHFHNYD